LTVSLRDEEFVKKVKDDIKQVIEEYECDPSVDLDNCDKDFNISFQLLWEMVKIFTFLTNSSSLNRLLLNFHVPLPLV
jgi:hypothetical protein